MYLDIWAALTWQRLQMYNPTHRNTYLHLCRYNLLYKSSLRATNEWYKYAVQHTVWFYPQLCVSRLSKTSVYAGAAAASLPICLSSPPHPPPPQTLFRFSLLCLLGFTLGATIWAQSYIVSLCKIPIIIHMTHTHTHRCNAALFGYHNLVHPTTASPTCHETAAELWHVNFSPELTSSYLSFNSVNSGSTS